MSKQMTQKQRATQIVKITIGDKVKRKPATRRKRRQATQKKESEEDQRMRFIAQSRPYLGSAPAQDAAVVARLNQSTEFNNKFEQLENKLQLAQLKQERQQRELFDRQMALFQSAQLPAGPFQPVQQQPAAAASFQPLPFDEYSQAPTEEEEPAEIPAEEPAAAAAAPEEEAEGIELPPKITKFKQINDFIAAGRYDEVIEFIRGSNMSLNSFRTSHTTPATRERLAEYMGLSAGSRLPHRLYNAIMGNL
jgi:hypothetical protein